MAVASFLDFLLTIMLCQTVRELISLKQRLFLKNESLKLMLVAIA